MVYKATITIRSLYSKEDAPNHYTEEKPLPKARTPEEAWEATRDYLTHLTKGWNLGGYRVSYGIVRTVKI